MKKTYLAILLVLVMLMSLAPMAWADDTSGTVTPSVTLANNTPSSVQNAVYGYGQQIKSELQTLKGLDTQANTQYQQLKSQTQTNEGLLKQIFNTTQPLRQQIQTLRSDLASTTDKTQKQQLRAQINVLEQQLESMRGARQQGMASVLQLWSQEDTLWSQVSSLQSQKSGLWSTIYTEYQSKDYADIVTNLQQVINLKQQIIVLLPQILTVKQQVTADLQSLLSNMSSTAPSNTPPTTSTT